LGLLNLVLLVFVILLGLAGSDGRSSGPSFALVALFVGVPVAVGVGAYLLMRSSCSQRAALELAFAVVAPIPLLAVLRALWFALA
jgi:hypothetical protein